MGSTIRVEVVYALPEGQDSVQLEVPVDTTVGEVLARSGMSARHPEIRLGKQSVGIYGRAVSMSAVPQDGDRIEIYRPLATDPKTARRLRAARARGR